MGWEKVGAGSGDFKFLNFDGSNENTNMNSNINFFSNFSFNNLNFM